MKRAQLLVAILASGAMVIGCGSNSGDASEQVFTVSASTTMSTGPLTKKQFVGRVNKVCRHGWYVILDNFKKYSSWQSPRLNRKALFAKSVRISFLAGLDFHVFDNIRQLKAPEGEGKSVEEVIGKMQRAVERGQQELHAYTPAQLSAQFANYNQAARLYGLGDCLVDGSRLVVGRRAVQGNSAQT
jgi:hypothetical protein